MLTVCLCAASTTQDARLNYVEQHADRLGLDAGRLEGARVSAAGATPMWDTIDLSLKALPADEDGSVMAALVARLVALLRSAVGLATRAGTARLVGTLAARVPLLVQPHAPALVKVRVM